MDGGSKQEEMAQILKREVKMNAHRRRLYAAGDRSLQRVQNLVGNDSPQTDQANWRSIKPADVLEVGLMTAESSNQPAIRSDIGGKCPILGHSISNTTPLAQSDAILLMFYLDNLFPFIFPFYQPDPLATGGKAWILEMITSSPMLRQVALCQSSYFFNLAQGKAHDDLGWQKSLERTRDAFATLKQALSVINSSSITEHLHGAVRILTGIVQVQRFEIAALSFENCRAHLDAAIALFQQLLKDSGSLSTSNSRSRFATTADALGPPHWTYDGSRFPTAEQAALRFSSALLVHDDIIAGTILGEPPRLYEHHEELLLRHNNAAPELDLESVTGCQGWVLLRIGEISMLDAWKQKCRQAGTLDVMELVQRAETIKDSLRSFHKHPPQASTTLSPGIQHIPEVFASGRGSKAQTTVTTCIWSHAALLYLSIVVSGWQPANSDVQYHVKQILDLSSYHLTPSTLTRTVAWPFCVAGCLAQPSEEIRFRNIVNALEPHNVFGTLRKGLQIMESVWRERVSIDNASFDLTSCFAGHGELVLLV